MFSHIGGVSPDDNRCVDLPEFDGQPRGTVVGIADCKSGVREDNQLWRLESVRPDYFRFRNIASDLCLGVESGEQGADTPVVIEDCSDPGTVWLMPKRG